MHLARHPRVLAVALLVLAGIGTSLLAGQGAAKPPGRRFEFVNQEVQADALTQTLNDLDGQGWDIFQVTPSWAIRNENGEAQLAPRAYMIFGRRPFGGKP
jgi:hypothetical protein